MLSSEELAPLVAAARQVKTQCERDTDKTLRLMTDKAFCQTFIAQRHAMLYERKMAEATITRAYADQLSVTLGMQRQAERERLRASTLEMQARKHWEASEKCQLDGDTMEAECLTMLKRRNGTQAQPAAAAPPRTPPMPPPRRIREPIPRPAGGDGDGDGNGDGQ
jgi:hypothetical protein